MKAQAIFRSAVGNVLACGEISSDNEGQDFVDFLTITDGLDGQTGRFEPDPEHVSVIEPFTGRLSFFVSARVGFEDRTGRMYVADDLNHYRISPA